MTPKDFLCAVWPAVGPYCIAYQDKLRDSEQVFHKNIAVDTIDEALAVSSRLADKYDMYFAMHGITDKEVWDPNRFNKKTGQLGKMVIRTHANMRSTRCYYFDIDVKPGEKKAYKTQRDALVALMSWIRTTQLPIPTIISSGSGLHVYWLLTSEVPSLDWKPYAIQLQQLAQHHSLRTDSSCTTDQARILRIPETFNLKNGGKRLVQILKEGAVTSPKVFQRAVRDAMTRAGVTALETPKFPGSKASEWGESNLNTEYTGPKPTLKEVVDACPQVREMVRLRGNLDQSAWYLAQLGTIKYVDDGERLAHLTSQGHPNYSKSETDFKLAQLEGKGPARCETIAKYMPGGDSACIGCPFANDPSVPNPLAAARKTTKAAAPIAHELIAGQLVATTTIPDPPAPYARLKDGGISRRGKSADGDDSIEVIYPYDLYPIRRLTNPESGIEQQLWCVELPIAGKKEFMLEAHALYDMRKFTETIAHQGIYPHKSCVPYLQDYMVAYISELQKLAASDTQSNHLGWLDDYTKFILPDRVLCADGSTKAAMLTTGAQNSAEFVHSAGTLERQVALMKFWEHPGYVAHQCFLLGGLGSTLMHMTDQHGLIVNASGPAGASKSTAVYTNAGYWGVPKQYAINGTNDGATTKSRNERVSTMANLPVCVDEVTHLPVKEAQNLAMFVTQPTGRLRLRTDGTERRSGSKYKSTIMLTSANSSLHNLLSLDNAAGTAGSMRVFEIEFRLTGVHEKPDADEYMRELQKNYGHIGPAFAAYVVQNHAAVEARVHAVMREMDRLLNIEASERFWSAYVACCLVAGEIAKKLGLLNFDLEAIKRWLIHVQLPHMRGIIKEEYLEPISILADYLESIAGNIIFVEQAVFTGTPEPYVKHRPHGSLLAHYDIENAQMYVLKDGFKRYCAKMGASMHKILGELNTVRRDMRGNLTKVVLERTTKKTLGSGTEYAKAQSSVFVIDMSHPDVGEGTHPLAKIVQRGLRVVE